MMLPLVRARERKPIVHCITNIVTVCRCADALHAVGASPIMADDPEEVCDIVSGSAALCINIGTPSRRRLDAMLAAGARANELDIPVVLDPVGAGASRLREDIVRELLARVKFAVIRGNAAEIRALATGERRAKGLDADDAIDIESALCDADGLSGSTGAVVAVTGAVDVVSYGGAAYAIRGGSPSMRSVTGAGCQLSAIMAAFTGVCADDPLSASISALCVMGACGSRAARALGRCGGASLQARLLDELAAIEPGDVMEEIIVEKVQR